MHKYGFSVPVLPGKDAREPARGYEADPAGYEQSRRQMGTTLDRVYLMPTPMGEFVSVYIEGEKDFVAANMTLAASTLPVDVKFRQAVKEVHGFDFDAPPTGPPPELIAEWWDPEMKERKKGLAFTAPLAPGKTELGRKFSKEAFQDRVDEFTASRRRLGSVGEVIFLNVTPMGDAVTVYLEAEDPADANRRFAASQEPFDVWFRDEYCRSIFPEYIDFSVPLPPISTLWDRQLTPTTV